jgi:hypothetical protein
MTKLFLTGIAALLLATETAHAGCHEWFYRCDNKLVSVQGCTKWGFSEVISRTKYIELSSRAFQLREKGDAGSGLYFRGRKCSCLDALNKAEGVDQCREP